MWTYIGGLVIVVGIGVAIWYSMRAEGSGQSSLDAEDHNGD